MRLNIYVSILLLGFIGIMGISCSPKIPFTEEDSSFLEKKNINLEEIQFYNSEALKLSRIVDEKEAAISKGKIKKQNNIFVETITIPRYTPGVFLDYTEKGALKVAFEEGAFQYLIFNHPKGYGDIYHLQVHRRFQGKEYVIYDGLEYEIVGESRLLFRQLKKKQTTGSTRIAKGRKIGTDEE